MSHPKRRKPTIRRAPLAAAALLTTGAALAGFTMHSGSTASTASALSESTQTNAAKEYAVDIVHSNIIFKIRHSGISNFYGRFKDFQGDIRFDPRNVKGMDISFSVETGSVDTNNRTRDGHIKNADFFNARQYPQATFTSTSIVETGSEGVYELNGDFSIHGVTQPITATITDVSTGKQQGKDAMGFEARFSISRSDFGITKYVDPKDPEGGPLGDKVEIIVAIEAVHD